MIRRLSLFALTLLSTIAIAQTSHSHPSSPFVTFRWNRQAEVYEARVTFTDLDLTSVEDAATLVERLRLASDGVCREGLRLTSLYDWQDYRRCYATAIAGGVGQLKSPLVTALAASGRPPVAAGG